MDLVDSPGLAHAPELPSAIRCRVKTQISVDSPGIEPGYRQCECRVIPLYYEPVLEPFDERSEFKDSYIPACRDYFYSNELKKFLIPDSKFQILASYPIRNSSQGSVLSFFT